MIDERTIPEFTAFQILSENTMFDLTEEDPERQALLSALLMVKARELGIEKEFIKVLKAYNKADKKLADEYTREQAIQNSEIPLKFDGKGQPLQTIENFITILRRDDYFKEIKFNLLTYSPETTENWETRRWTDADDSRARRYIETNFNLHHPTKLDDALRIIFKEREYHPVKQIIESIEWDGIERIPTLLIKWLKCEDTAYTREVSRLIFSGGINRLYNPGCKFDDVPILIGTKQGEGKSTFVRWLALKDEYFAEIGEIEGQKGMEALEGAWICEIAELLALTKAKEVEAVKSYITRQVDRYRRPFDRRVTDHKRQCVFIGTTNKEQFLTDKTGNRRFYPLKVNQSGYDLFNSEKEIKADILQCWAEARAKYDKGDMKPFADRSLLSEIKKAQQSAVEDDYRDGLIEDYLYTRSEVCILQIWKDALGNEFTKPNKKESNEIALYMQSLSEWEKQDKPKRFGDFGLQRYWTRKQQSEKSNTEDLLSDLPF